MKRHNRFVMRWIAVYLLCAVSIGYLVNFGPLSEKLHHSMVERVLIKRAASEPGNAFVHRSLAMLYHESGRYPEAVSAYERSLEIEPDHPVALNNLAWLLATASDHQIRNLPLAIELAEKAVALERNPMFLDTLAEAYYAAGRTSEALALINEAIDRADENLDYYLEQRDKFLSGAP